MLARTILNNDDFDKIEVNEPLVVLPKKDFNEFIVASNKLDALEAMGVDNWEGYSEAMREFYADDEEEFDQDEF